MVKISFIIPTYLRPDALKQKISEINLFEKEEVEFIFVIERDDENTYKLLIEAENKKIRIIFNKGIHTKSFLNGADAANGKYLCFMGDDDYFLPDNFFSALKKINLDGDREWYIAGGIYYDQKKQQIRKIITNLKFLLLKNYNKNALTLVNFIMTPSVIIKKETFFECGGFKSEYKYAQDYYCWLEVSKKYEPEIINSFTTGATFDDTTYSGSFDFKRYIEYFKKISKFQESFILNFLQFFTTAYIVFHNFFFKNIFRSIKKILGLIFYKRKNDDSKLNKSQKILHLTRKFNLKELGGIEEGIIQLSNYSQNKFEFTLYACGESNKSFKYKNINVKIFKTNFILFNSHFSFDLFFEILKKKKYFNFIHLHSPWPTIEVISYFLKNKAICTYHADVIGKKFLSNIYYVFFKKFINLEKIKLINISTKKYYLSSRLKKLLNNNNEKVFFQKMGIEDISNFDIKDELIRPEIKEFYEKKDKIALFFGRDRHYKGVETIKYLLKKNNEINFLISSTNPEINNLKINSNNVLHIDKLNLDEKIFVLKNSYIHLFPSSNRAESLGIALIECQMFGLPSIIYELESGTNVVIENDVNGMIVKDYNISEYSNKLSYIVKEETKRDILSKNARINYVNNFTLDMHELYFKKLSELNV